MKPLTTTLAIRGDYSMGDFIEQYWVQTLLTTVTSVLTFFVKMLYNKIKRDYESREQRFEEERKEQLVIKKGVLAILHDRLYQSCTHHLETGSIRAEDLKNLEYLYESYRALGGNGTGNELYRRCCNLPLTSRRDIKDNG